MKTINEVQDEIIEEFSMFDDWMDKYANLIEMGNELNDIDPKYKVDNFLIKGCQSRVWLYPTFEDGKIHFEGESDAIIVKGLVSLLLKVYEDRTPKEILESELYFIDDIGLTQHLSPTRSNGLLSMVKQMRLYAIAYDRKINS
ncbi:SufE family protein [Halosquirtibacter xylanolyticus]|uniref:SufE family protein n=1 Tax=Halosquirtibacter xylanolyticus TaxID=3374599 RepID=UPI0037491EF9|nr:SufE family protein [Prolixibacteraceae bacterium]